MQPHGELSHLFTVLYLVIDKTGTLTIPNQNIDFTKQEDLDLETRETLKPVSYTHLMQLAYHEPNAKYITLKLPQELYIPEEIAEKSVGIAGDIAQSLKELNTNE